MNSSPDIVKLICPPPLNVTNATELYVYACQYLKTDHWSIEVCLAEQWPLFAFRYPCGPGLAPNCTCAPWLVPTDAILPLMYWIVFNSAVAYFLMTWGNKWADASKVGLL